MWKKKEFWVGISIGATLFGGVAVVAWPSAPEPKDPQTYVVQYEQRMVKLCNEDEGCDVYICDPLKPR